MVVLSIIGVIILSICVYLFISKVNSISYKNYKYEFFNGYVLALFALIYILLYFGRSYYLEAVARDGDIWNGILLFSIGIIIFIIRLILNIKIAGFFKGILYTLLQVIIYIPLAIIGIIVLFIAMGIASETRPVYRIN